MKLLFCIALLLMLPAISTAAEEAAVVGHIQTLQGSVWIERGALRLGGEAGSEVRQGDTLRTGKPGAVGLVLLDNTTVSLGSGSQLVVRDYAFQPREGKFTLVMQMLKGSFSYVSGLIGKLAPDAIRLQLPEATIAVRGTKLLVEIGD